jgi:hypothetical protein
MKNEIIYELDATKIKDLEDVKKILNSFQVSYTFEIVKQFELEMYVNRPKQKIIQNDNIF